MSLSSGADELLRATKKALAEAEAKLQIAHAMIVRQDAEDAIARSGASSPSVLAYNMAAVGRIASNGRDVEYDRAGLWLDRDAFVAELKRDPETSRFFAGAIPETSPAPMRANPFSRATFNLTQQMKIIRENPDLAARLRREAE